MKTLNLEISLEDIDLNNDDKEKTPQELAAFWVRQIMLMWANQPRVVGNQQQALMPETDRKIFYKIDDKLEEAIKEKKPDVEFEDAEFGFIKKCKREVNMMPSKILRRIEEKIEEVQER
jgi:hypothetical protein